MQNHQCGPSCSHHQTDAKPQIGEEFNEAHHALLHALPAHKAAVDDAAAAPASASATEPVRIAVQHHYIPVNAQTILWGYFSKLATPVVKIDSGDFVTMETLTHHANDDAERMVQGDAGAESVFFWDAKTKNVNRRGAGAMDAKVGAGGGLGVHICTGPVHIHGAEAGDVLEVRIVDVVPRPSANPLYKGKTFGSNAAANWGFHYGDTLTEPKQREVITIYEVDASGERNWARAVYNYRWTPQTDPFGVVHATIDYPGVKVDHRASLKTIMC